MNKLRRFAFIVSGVLHGTISIGIKNNSIYTKHQ